MFLPPKCLKTCNQLARYNYPACGRSTCSFVFDLVPFDMSSVVYLHSTPLHLPDVLQHLLTWTFNTLPFEQSTFRRFVHSRWKACTAGHLPSFIQLRNKILISCFSWHTQPATKADWKTKDEGKYKKLIFVRLLELLPIANCSLLLFLLPAYCQTYCCTKPTVVKQALFH